jgi:hypothetical protein
MEPEFLQEPYEANEKLTKKSAGKKRYATWWCLPYFYLDKYSGDHSGAKSGQHPLQTLLQARFVSTKEGRDKQQASCQVLDGKPLPCFHIAQLWCVVLDQCMYCISWLMKLNTNSFSTLSDLWTNAIANAEW